MSIYLLLLLWLQWDLNVEAYHECNDMFTIDIDLNSFLSLSSTKHFLLHHIQNDYKAVLSVNSTHSMTGRIKLSTAKYVETKAKKENSGVKMKPAISGSFAEPASESTWKTLFDSKPFLPAAERIFYVSGEEAEIKALELCSLWETHLKDPSWHPFKVMDKGGKTKKEIKRKSKPGNKDQTVISFYGATNVDWSGWNSGVWAGVNFWVWARI
ncbi:hypothetical protein F8388_023945 [Cannabis sativa]|uniref:Factor of DNA methylation 1-5/IDN2 domain-containing protein n=1 Tax=Cannabis sativa TaxID=3483 RepID=A0A7J6EUJ1_CANSA|nr:hypothetical protein F8388_023945 [Cannabis sativa]